MHSFITLSLVIIHIRNIFIFEYSSCISFCFSQLIIGTPILSVHMYPNGYRHHPRPPFNNDTFQTNETFSQSPTLPMPQMNNSDHHHNGFPSHYHNETNENVTFNLENQSSHPPHNHEGKDILDFIISSITYFFFYFSFDRKTSPSMMIYGFVQESTL